MGKTSDSDSENLGSTPSSPVVPRSPGWSYRPVIRNRKVTGWVVTRGGDRHVVADLHAVHALVTLEETDEERLVNAYRRVVLEMMPQPGLSGVDIDSPAWEDICAAEGLAADGRARAICREILDDIAASGGFSCLPTPEL